MSKIPCGGFELGESLIMKDGKLDLAEGGGSITVDSELSDTSENPVQNKVIKSALDALAIPTLHITVTSLNTETMETTFTADKTVAEMYAVSGPTWCVVTVPASVSPSGSEMVLECSSFKRGFAFGYGLVPSSEADFDYAVKPGSGDNWKLVFRNLM